MKRKNIKIKHHKYNFYNKNKKKSKGRQVLAIILTIVLAAALCVVGFGIGKPLMDYFNGNKTPDTSSSGWTPPVETVDSTDTDTAPETEDAESTESAEPIPEARSIFILPEGAAVNEARLNSTVSSAKAQGYTTVVVTLKNDTGNFLYKTEVAGVKDSKAVAGTLTAKQICDIITNAGLTPQARISTLKDHTSSAHVSDIKFTTSDGWGWLDAAAANGGKTWLSPFEPKTSQYMADITAELAAAGFKKIILADMKFPPFRDADDKYLTHIPIHDEQARLTALWNVITACSTAARGSGADVMLEMSASDMDAADRLSTPAEAAGDKEKLKTVELLIIFTSENGSSTTAAGAFTGKMGGMYSGQSYSVRIAKDGYIASDYEAIITAFSNAGVTVFSE